MARAQAEIDDRLCFAVYAASHAFTRAYRPLLARIGLTYPQYLVMLVLWERDGPTVRTIGDALFLDSGTLTPLLRRLEAMGLVDKTRDPDDERQVRVRLTAAGRGLRERAAGVHEAMGCRLGASASEMRDLADRLGTIRDRLRATPDA